MQAGKPTSRWTAPFESQSSGGTSATHTTGGKLMPTSITDTVKPSDYHTVDVTTASLEFVPSNALHKHRLGNSVYGSTRASGAGAAPPMSPISSGQSGGTFAQFHSRGTSGGQGQFGHTQGSSSGGGSYSRHAPSSQDSALAAAAAAAAARRPPPPGPPSSGGGSSGSVAARPAPPPSNIPTGRGGGNGSGRGGAMLPMAPPVSPTPPPGVSRSRPVDFSYAADTGNVGGDTVGMSVDFGVSAYQRPRGNTGGMPTNVGSHASQSPGRGGDRPSPRGAQRAATPSRPSGSSLSDPPTPPLTVRTPEGVITSFPRKPLERVRSRLDRADTTAAGVPKAPSADSFANGGAGSSGGSGAPWQGASPAGSPAPPGIDTPDGGTAENGPPPPDARIEDLLLWLNMQLDQIAGTGDDFIFMRKYRLLGPADRRQGGACSHRFRLHRSSQHKSAVFHNLCDI